MVNFNKKKLFIVFLLAILATGLMFYFREVTVNFFKQVIYWPLFKLCQQTLFTWPFYLFIAGILLIEQLFPADKQRKLLSVSFAQDIIWFFIEGIGHALIISTYVAFLYVIYERHFSFLTLERMSLILEWGRLIIGIFLLDFLFWLQHFLHHKIPWLWHFHAIHHSQKEVNLFTDFRYHTLEYVLRHTVLTIPFLLLGLKYPTVIYFVLFQTWFTRFYHANIKTNLGLLRYVLVTPQSHRVHHSIEPQHYDRNFGSLFCIWDMIFKTQYYGFDEYPKTGIPDASFPHETSKSFGSLLVTPFKQMWYPFPKIAESFKVKK